MDNRALLTGIGLGAALAYLFDPQAGRGRRALARDKAARSARIAGEALDATARDLGNRTAGVMAATRGRWSDDGVDDSLLIERVRAKLGRRCSHPHAIDVEVRDGEVTLRGPILADEVDTVMTTAASVRGVRSVISELEPHETAAGIPSLQGEGRVAGRSLDLLQRNWAPGTRALVGVGAVAAGGILVAYARR